SPEPTQSGIWAKVGRRITVRPRTVWAVTGALLLVACLGLLRLDTNGLASDEQYTKEFGSVTGQKVLLDHGLVDASNPIMVAADAERADEVAEAISGVEGLGEVSEPVTQDGVAFITAAIPGDPIGQGAFDLVEDVRAAVADVEGGDALVGGFSAIYLDT